MITFYDLSAKDGIKTWSPNSWKTRYVLNYKKLAYRTVTLEYPDIEGEFKRVGIPPSDIKPDGTGDLYTSPSIIDEATKKAITDSYKVAEYLDKAYPSTPPVFPAGTEALQASSYHQLEQVLQAPLWPLLLPKIPPAVLNPPSVEYFVHTRGVWFGVSLADLEPHGEARVEAWKKLQAAFDTAHGWLSKSSGPYFAGETVTFVDFVVAAHLNSIKICFGEKSEEWKNVETWSGGRWKTFLESLDKYAGVEN